MFTVYRVDLCDVAIKMFESSDLDKAKEYRNILYLGDENARHEGEPVQMFRYIIVED